MSSRQTSSAWSNIRRRLESWSQPALIALVKDLYAASPGNRDFLQARCATEKDGEAALETYRRKIVDQFFPPGGIGKLKLAEARKAIRDYRKASGDLAGTIDLMLTYVENGTKFTLEFGDLDAAYCNSLESVLTEMETLLCREGADLYPRFRERLLRLETEADGIGWGYGDSVRERVRSLESELSNDEDEDADSVEPEPESAPTPKDELRPNGRMNPPAKVSDLVDALESSDFEEHRSYFDRHTGRIVIVEQRILRAVEEGDEETLRGAPDWQKKEIETAREMARDSGGRFIAPPNEYDFDEYRHMERFIGSLSDERAADQLWKAVKGRGAFRRFKDTLYQLGIQDQWFRYRDDAMKEFVIEWAEAHGVPLEDDTRQQHGR